MKEFDPEDPFALVGVVLPPPSDDDLAEMGRCFVEEFARMGWSPELMLRVFRSPFYRGPHAVYHRRGEEFVRGLIRQVGRQPEASRG